MVLARGEQGASLAGVALPAPFEDGVVAAVDVAADDEADAGVEAAAAAAALSE